MAAKQLLIEPDELKPVALSSSPTSEQQLGVLADAAVVSRSLSPIIAARQGESLSRLVTPPAVDRSTKVADTPPQSASRPAAVRVVYSPTQLHRQRIGPMAFDLDRARSPLISECKVPPMTEEPPSPTPSCEVCHVELKCVVAQGLCHRCWFEKWDSTVKLGHLLGKKRKLEDSRTPSPVLSS